MNDINECDSGQLYNRYNQFIQDYLVKNNVDDFTKYEFYMNHSMKPSFSRWEYSIDKPIFKKHDTHIKITNIENRLDLLEKSKENEKNNIELENKVMNLEKQVSDFSTLLKDLSDKLSKLDLQVKQPKVATKPSPSLLSKR
jgi:hypothetical protein